MVSKFEAAGIAISIACMAVAIYVIQLQNRFDNSTDTQAATVVQGLQVVGAKDTNNLPVVDNKIIQDMKINDITVGGGQVAETGDRVAVHYVGQLQDGTEFDNSHKRGAPIEFTLGAGEVIPGWEEGVLGMKVGGERTLVIPPDKAYGEAGVGPIPPNATLVFTVSLEAVNG